MVYADWLEDQDFPTNHIREFFKDYFVDQSQWCRTSPYINVGTNDWINDFDYIYRASEVGSLPCFRNWCEDYANVHDFPGTGDSEYEYVGSDRGVGDLSSHYWPGQ